MKMVAITGLLAVNTSKTNASSVVAIVEKLSINQMKRKRIVTNYLLEKVSETLQGENLFEVNDGEVNLVGVRVNSPTHLTSLVKNKDTWNAIENRLEVFFVNDEQKILGSLVFRTDAVESTNELDHSHLVAGYISESASDFESYEAVTVAHGKFFTESDVSSWLSTTFETENTLDILNINGDKWTSAMCSGQGCCDPDGTEIPPIDYYEPSLVTTKSDEEEDDDTHVRESIDELINFLTTTLSKIDKE